MKIGIFGGTFDPIHNGHIEMANLAKESLNLDEIYLVVTSNSPFKNKSTDAIKRLEMTKIAVENHPDIKVCDYEVQKGGISYTSDTLQYFANKNLGAQLYFIMGTDQALQFEKWSNTDLICELCTPVCMKRSHEVVNDPRFRLVNNDLFDVSSSNIRDGELKNIDNNVLKYIIDNELYFTKEYFDMIRPLVSNRRFEHSKRVAILSAKLANWYGVDTYSAVIASILHDMYKEKIVNTFDKYEHLPKSVRHGYVAAELLEGKCSKQIREAIKNHTIGDIKMDDVSKILYVADYIEPGREVKKAVQLRENCQQLILDELVLEVTKNSLNYLENCGLKPHYKTIKLLEALENEIKK